MSPLIDPRGGAVQTTSGSIGGGLLLAGATATVAVPGAQPGMMAVCSPNTFPGVGGLWYAYVSAADTVTIVLQAIIAWTPTASTYNVLVLK
jgi:hypothetical protein